MSLEAARLTLMPCSPAHLLALIEQPERFEQLAAGGAPPGLYGPNREEMQAMRAQMETAKA